MEINHKQLIKFLLKAKSKTYAADGKEIIAQRPGFKELEFKEGDWEYRDSYIGFYFAPGQEIVRFKGQPIWAMAYSGGMNLEYHGDKEFAKQTFNFLKKALLKVKESRPFRGPEEFKEGDYKYTDSSEGDVKDFKGTEKIFYKNKEIFKQDYVGGIVVPK